MVWDCLVSGPIRQLLFSLASSFRNDAETVHVRYVGCTVPFVFRFQRNFFLNLILLWLLFVGFDFDHSCLFCLVGLGRPRI